MKSIHLGKLFGLQMSFTSLLLVGVIGMWFGLSLAGFYFFGIAFREAILLGFVAMLSHYLLEWIHSLGHAIAAKWMGYPMIEIQFGIYGIYAKTIYPENEPELPSSTHIIRALGGPIANFILAFILFGTLSLWHGNWYWVGLFIFLDNLVYVVQVFIPLGFNDASTILRELRKNK